MLSTHTIGHTTLSLSLLIYSIYFLPQIWHNRKQHHAQALSRWLHILFVLGYCADWIYGAGNHLAWEYRTVTTTGLLALAIQHIQLRPKIFTKQTAWHYATMSALIIALYTLAITISAHPQVLTETNINLIGFLSTLCWLSAFMPQILRNYREKNGNGISHLFISITLVTASLDWISACCLHWPWPSLISPPILITVHAACWLQQRYYQATSRIPRTV